MSNPSTSSGQRLPSGTVTFLFTDIEGLNDSIQSKVELTVKAKKTDGKVIEFKATTLLNTDVEVNYYRNGGILHTVLRNLVK